LNRVQRRQFLIAAGALLAIPLADGQQAAKVARIGHLPPNLAASPQLRDAFLQGLRDLGYVEGRNVVIEYRDAEGKLERLPALAAELVARKVDVILAEGGTLGPRVAMRATRTIPIVFAGAGDPVGSGLVTSLARPGGNVTGLSSLSAEVVGKRLELLTRPFRGSIGSLSSGSPLPLANAQQRTCWRQQTSRRGRRACSRNSSRREARTNLPGLSPT
jgi:ABC-type uncharacterized transport system substrate-binding protein